MRDGDGLLMANFRADRVRQLLAALLDPDFTGFARKRRPVFAAALGMGEYSTELNRFHSALFPAEELRDTLGELLARAGKRQLRIAETEKYAHVTFFFNGGEEKVFPGEERILIPSPKVATYDLQPEMSAYEVTDKLVAAIAGGSFDFIVVNFANTDMVGHSGKLAPAIAAVEAVDRCLGRLEEAVKKAGGVHAGDRRSRQCRDDVRPADRRAPYRPYAEPRTAGPGQWSPAMSPASAMAGWRISPPRCWRFWTWPSPLP